MSLNKEGLVKKMAEGAGITSEQAERALLGLAEAVGEAVDRGGKVAIAGLGTWHVTVHSPGFDRGVRTRKVMRLAVSKPARRRLGRAFAARFLSLIRDLGDEMGDRAC